MKKNTTFTQLKKLKDQYQKTFKTIIQGSISLQKVQYLNKLKKEIAEKQKQICQFQESSGLPLQKKPCGGTLEPMIKAKKQFDQIIQSVYLKKVSFQEEPAKLLVDELAKANEKCFQEFQNYLNSTASNNHYEPKIKWGKKQVRVIPKQETYWGALNKRGIKYKSPKHPK